MIDMEHTLAAVLKQMTLLVGEKARQDHREAEAQKNINSHEHDAGIADLGDGLDLLMGNLIQSKQDKQVDSDNGTGARYAVGGSDFSVNDWVPAQRHGRGVQSCNYVRSGCLNHTTGVQENCAAGFSVAAIWFSFGVRKLW